mmetsp:Transcript_87548/g.245947  ORF Transcript_87548/g.245947 Transcript_87548/m.245947 type:complete len:471 (-) Transcript_87548:68-1480(-)
MFRFCSSLTTVLFGFVALNADGRKLVRRIASDGVEAKEVRAHGTRRVHGSEDLSALSQSVHWVFVTDCSAYMFNQANMLLESAYGVGQPGQFTWVTYGCTREEQKAAVSKFKHPSANVWHAQAVTLTDPLRGKPYSAFQASNRPVSLLSWWRATQPKEDAIGIMDPDMFWMRPTVLLDSPNQLAAGHWETYSALPGRSSAARYGLGCLATRWNYDQLKQICGAEVELCVKAKQDETKCTQQYSSGPPWVLHRADVEKVLGSWMDTAINVHSVWPDLLAEQAAYGMTQMRYKVSSTLDAFWFLSNTEANEQPWDAVAKVDWDPCRSRAPPPMELSLPPLWHACSTFVVPGFAMHKDHLHKDLLDCKAPLIHYPPEDALEKYNGQRGTVQFRNIWSVCMYTNLVNHYVKIWKTRNCKAPNVEATFSYPAHSATFVDPKSWLALTFRKGGWSDIDYRAQGRSLLALISKIVGY